MKYPPPIETSLAELPEDPQKRHEFLVDVFGRYVFWAIDKALERSAALVDSPELRAKVGRIFREPYTKAAEQLTKEQQLIALGLAKDTVYSFAKELLGVLTAQGTSHLLGESHAIRFRLFLEICEAYDMNVVFEELINRGGEKAFFDYWGRWLNQHTKREGY